MKSNFFQNNFFFWHELWTVVYFIFSKKNESKKLIQQAFFWSFNWFILYKMISWLKIQINTVHITDALVLVGGKVN